MSLDMLNDDARAMRREVLRLRGDGGPVRTQGVTMDRGRVRLRGNPLHDDDAVPKRWLDTQIVGHNHDARYYTEAEVDALIAALTATGSVGFVPEDVLSTTGTAHTLANTPANAASVMLWLNGQRLKRVASAPGSLQFSVSGATVTTGYSVTAGDTLVASYVRASQGILVPEEVLGTTGLTHTLAYTPTSAADVILFLNGQRLKRVASGPSALQFSVSGATITTGYSVTSGDTLTATYIR